MNSVVVWSSFVLKGITLLILLGTFKLLSVPEKARKNAGFLTRYYLMRKNYTLLRASLLFVAAIILLEILEMTYMMLNPNGTMLNDALILFSDVVLTGLIVLLAKVYKMRKISDAELKYLSEEK